MSFKTWMENNHLVAGEWKTFTGTGYSVELTQYSNKGPLFIVKDAQNQEIGRTYFDMFSMGWKPSR